MNINTFFSIIILFVFIIIQNLISGQENQYKKTLLQKKEYIPDIATFMQIGYNSPAGYSWDGKKVFFMSSMSGVPQVYRLTNQKWPYQLSTFEDGIDFFQLSFNSEMAIIGASVGGSEQSQLYLMDTETGRVLQLTNFENVQFGTVQWARDDNSIYYRSNQENGTDFFIYQMDITKGISNKIFGDTLTVKGYNAIAVLSEDGEKLIIYNFTSNVSNDLYLLNLSDGNYKKINKDNGNVLNYSPTLMPDNNTIWFICNDNKDGILRLAKMKSDDPDVEFIDDGWIDLKWEVEDLIFSRDYRYMAAIVNTDGYLRLKLRETATNKELPSPPLDGMLSGGIFDWNGSCLISYSGPTYAPDVWRWNPATRKLEKLTYAIYAGIDREIFRQPQLIHYKSFDGLEIPAFLYLPPEFKKGKPIPFIVHAHGGPESQFQPEFIRNIQYLLLNGYGVIAPNVRGSSGYGLEYMNLDNYKNRKHSLKDYKAAVEWLFEHKYTEQGMIGIRGGSYGGYVVMGMITEYPDLFSAAVNVVGIVNFKTFLENTKPYRRALRESEYGPLSDSEFLKLISPIYKVDLIKTPLLVIHGENDPRVPIGEARQIIQAIKDKNGVVESLIFPDEGHGASKRVNVIAEYRKQVEFFNRYLKPEDKK